MRLQVYGLKVYGFTLGAKRVLSLGWYRLSGLELIGLEVFRVQGLQGLRRKVYRESALGLDRGELSVYVSDFGQSRSPMPVNLRPKPQTLNP